VVPGEDRETVCPDLVGCVAVASDTVGAYDDSGDVLLFFHAGEECAGHGVGDESGGDIFEDQLEGC